MDKFQTLTTDDFCNSIVITWKKAQQDGSELSLVRKLLKAQKISIVPEQLTSEKLKRKYSELTFESDIPDTYLQYKVYRKGKCELVLSLPYQ